MVVFLPLKIGKSIGSMVKRFEDHGKAKLYESKKSENRKIRIEIIVACGKEDIQRNMK